MAFKMKYQIRQSLLTPQTRRRSGMTINKVKFIVAHDTGNEGSSARANVNYYERSRNEQSASAHIFVDGLEIIECIPAFQNPEKAWHVLYNVDSDNRRYGSDANDTAIGVELCFGGEINTEEAYRRYVWVLAYLCHLYGLEPLQDIAGHHELDPKRKTDPVNALRTINKTMSQLLHDVDIELQECTNEQEDEAMIEELLKRIEALENANKQTTVPDWAKEAIDAAVKKGFVKEANGGSLDFYRILTILHRAGVI